MPKNILTIDEAIDEIKQCHDRTQQKPLLVGIFGTIDSGKSYFCREACNKLALPNKVWGVYGSHDPSDSVINMHYNELEYLFYDVGINYENPGKIYIDLWNDDIRPYTGKDTDVNAYIFNPNHIIPDLEYLAQVFDIIISNPESKKKNLQMKQPC